MTGIITKPFESKCGPVDHFLSLGSAKQLYKSVLVENKINPHHWAVCKALPPMVAPELVQLLESWRNSLGVWRGHCRS